MGFLSGIALLWSLQLSKSRKRRVSTVLGYVLGGPFAFVGSLMSGLILDPIIGVSICGSLPLIVGAAFGYGIGKNWDK
jgi:hypothetical protein